MNTDDGVMISMVEDYNKGTSMRNYDNRGKQCEFRRGKCLVHNIKGDKMSRKIKKWGKKRYGYGWLTVTAIEYTCPYSSVSQDVTSSEISENISRSPGRVLGVPEMKRESNTGDTDYLNLGEQGLRD